MPTLDELPLKGDTVVGNDVWIGQRVTVLPGVHIGDGAIIGANAVVASDIPPYTIAAGNPCRVIRPRFSPELTEYLLALTGSRTRYSAIWRRCAAAIWSEYAVLRRDGTKQYENRHSI